MRIIFIGTVDFSGAALMRLIGLKANIAGLVTKSKSEFNSDFMDLTPIAVANDIPVHYSDDINAPRTIEWMKEKSPDILFCLGWSSLLKQEVLTLAPMGVLGYHPAALPSNRGRHPLIWALALGLSKTASTFFFMDSGADSGPILHQAEVPIDEDDDAHSLYTKVSSLALDQISAFFPGLVSGKFKLTAQDHNLSNYWRKRGKKDGEIDWRMSSAAIYNLVRALTKPYVGAHTIYKGSEVKIWKVVKGACDQANIEPGRILGVSGEKIKIKCYDGAIEVLSHEFPELPGVGEYL